MARFHLRASLSVAFLPETVRPIRPGLLLTASWTSQGLLYLLRRCHGLIYKLISSSEPISEELMPIANKLSTIKKCLNEVLKYGGPFSARDLYPYHLALNQIDGLRKDGKFYSQDGSDSIPEGQAILVAHLSECHELLEMCVAFPSRTTGYRHAIRRN